MHRDERNKRLRYLRETSEGIKTSSDFFEFVEEMLQAYRDGVYDEREGQKQNLDRYVENIGAIMFSETDDISETEARKQPSWSYVAWLLDRAFLYT